MFGFAAAGEVLPPDVPEFTGIGKAHDPLEVPNHCGKLAAPHLGERASDARVAPAENTVAPAFPTRQFGVVILEEWIAVDRAGERYFPHEFMYKILRGGKLEKWFQIDPRNSWLIAACE